MKRIAVFHNLPAGGARRHTYEQIRELANRGYQIHEYTQSTADLSFMPFDNYVTATHVYDLQWDALHAIPIRGVGPYIHLLQNRAKLDRLDRQSREIARQIDQEGFDLAFIKDCGFTIAPFVLRYLRTPTVFYMHSDPVFRSAAENVPPASLLERARTRPIYRHENMVYDEFIHNLRCAGLILTNSQFTRGRILARHGVESHVVYPGVDIDTFYPQPRSVNDLFVLSAGSLLPHKGHWFVIESLGLLPRELRPKLVISTATPNEEGANGLRQFAAKHDVAVEIRTVRDSDEMARLYSDAEVLLFAPSNEWLGLVALEAMACGTPVVGVREGGLIETIQDGKTGFLVERDPQQFALAVERLLTDPALSLKFGQQARQYIEEFWTWPRAVDDLEAHFHAVIQQHAVT